MPNPTTGLKPRYDCPVCIGLPMQKLKIKKKDGSIFVTLDCCQRCGGVWFDKDEVQLSQQIKSPKVRQRITQSPASGQTRCHSCNTLMDRNLDQCPACGWHNRIDCPICKKTLQRKQHNQLTLDVCHSCKGVWFDQVELLSLWSGSLIGFSKKQKATSENAAQLNDYSPSNLVTQTMGEVVAEASFDSMLNGIDIVEPGAQFIGHTAGHATSGGAEVIASVPDIAGSTLEALAEVTEGAIATVGEIPEVITVVLEVTGEVAGGMAEALAEIIAGLFS